MAKIIGFDEFYNIKKKVIEQETIRKEIENIEEKLGLEDDPLLVLSDELAMTAGNCLLDARNALVNVTYEIDRVLDILGIEETEELPDGIECQE